MSIDSNQIVYVLTNPAMPGLIKIGMTTQMEVEARMKQLYSTGVPVPYDCAFACQVKDASEVERALPTSSTRTAKSSCSNRSTFAANGMPRLKNGGFRCRMSWQC
jgi:hypothetical protein